jgi:hypothetical protein
VRAISLALISGLCMWMACARLSPEHRPERPRTAAWEAAAACERHFSSIVVQEVDEYGRMPFK